jgi:steroid 5-alpha reductase family enzyme
MFVHDILWSTVNIASLAILAAAAWAVAGVLMLALWRWHLRLRNAGVVDVGWAAGLALVSLLYAAFAPGDPRRRWLIAAMVAIWSARLVAYLLRDRVLGRPEDPRYQHLRQSGSIAAAGSFFAFFQAQAMLVVVLSTPMLIASANPAPAWSALEIGGALLWAAALAGETMADRQLERFKARGLRPESTCRDGLWRYSRHPNYFFEWLVWVAYALYAVGSPGGLVALSAPAIVLYLLFRVTGIPATEAQALRTRGDDYRRYQRETSAFVPWPPRRAS